MCVMLIQYIILLFKLLYDRVTTDYTKPAKIVNGLWQKYFSIIAC